MFKPDSHNPLNCMFFYEQLQFKIKLVTCKLKAKTELHF